MPVVLIFLHIEQSLCSLEYACALLDFDYAFAYSAVFALFRVYSVVATAKMLLDLFLIIFF